MCFPGTVSQPKKVIQLIMLFLPQDNYAECVVMCFCFGLGFHVFCFVSFSSSLLFVC